MGWKSCTTSREGKQGKCGFSVIEMKPQENPGVAHSRPRGPGVRAATREAVDLLQAAGAEEGAGVWLGATEALVENHRLFAAALLKEGATELHVDLRIVQALLLEILKCILVQDFCPEIAIVACRISAIEYMVEIGSPVARNDFPDQPPLKAHPCRAHATSCQEWKLRRVPTS